MIVQGWETPFNEWEKETLLRRLLDGDLSVCGTPESRALTAGSLALPCWSVALFELHGPGLLNGLFERSLIQILPDEEQHEVQVLGLEDWKRTDDFVLVTLVFRESGSRAGRVARIVAKLQEILHFSGVWVAAGLGSSTRSERDIFTSKEEASLACSYAVFRGEGIYIFDHEKEQRGLPMRDVEAYPERFAVALKSGEKEAIPQLTASWLAALKNTSTSCRRLWQETQRLFSRLADLVYDSVGSGPGFETLEHCYHVFDSVRTPEELRNQLARLCDQAAEALFLSGSSFADRKAEEFRQYIHEHYSDVGINLARVGQSLQISPSYLCKLIKRGTNRTFVEFLTEYRMEKARELLLGSDLATYQIAEHVGYLYTHYFSSLFKKHFSYTPSELRALRRKRA